MYLIENILTHCLGDKGTRQGRRANIHSTPVKFWLKRLRVAWLTGEYGGLISYRKHRTLLNRYMRIKKQKRYGASAMLSNPDKKRVKRNQLLSKQNGACAWCDQQLKQDITIDHILRLADGGKGNIENLQLLHHKCHVLKEQDYDRKRGQYVQETLPQEQLQSIDWNALKELNS